MPVRRPVQLYQPGDPRLPVPPQPHITGLARDPEAGAQLRHRLLIPFLLKDTPQLLFHHTARFPGHGDVVLAATPRSAVSDVSPVQNVSYVHGPYRTLGTLLPPNYCLSSLFSARWIAIPSKFFVFLVGHSTLRRCGALLRAKGMAAFAA
jgi:hypothetical protein